MARFEHLEFGPDPGEQAAPPAPVLIESEQQALRNALESRGRGQYENALRLYSRALEYDKSLVAGWVGQVQMLVQLDEAPEADLWARKALEVFPGNGEIMAARAQALCRTGDLPQAGALCDGAMAATGRSAFRWQARGEWMLATRQKLDEHCFAKAQEAEGTWLVALESALIYLHYSFPSRALMRARQATELAPSEFHPWFVRGEAEAALGMNHAASNSFDQCIQLSPRHLEAATRKNRLSGSWSPLAIWRKLRNSLRRR